MYSDAVSDLMMNEPATRPHPRGLSTGGYLAPLAFSFVATTTCRKYARRPPMGQEVTSLSPNQDQKLDKELLELMITQTPRSTVKFRISFTNN